jgi:hypothetical protein
MSRKSPQRDRVSAKRTVRDLELRPRKGRATKGGGAVESLTIAHEGFTPRGTVQRVSVTLPDERDPS